MPGSGKSTLGVLLAKALCLDFLDTDLVIQQREKMPLQRIIDSKGLEAFRRAERDALLSVTTESTVIATGGSAVYYPDAMEHLKNDGICVYLELPFEAVEGRIHNMKTRGIAIPRGMTLRGLYDERRPLYEGYADITLDCSEGSVEETLERLVAELKKWE